MLLLVVVVLAVSRVSATEWFLRGSSGITPPEAHCAPRRVNVRTCGYIEMSHQITSVLGVVESVPYEGGVLDTQSLLVVSSGSCVVPPTFAGVALFIDGEKRQYEKHMQSFGPRALYIGPRAPYAGARAMPYYHGSMTLTFDQLVGGRTPGLIQRALKRKSKLFAYIVSNCVPYREKAYDDIMHLFETIHNDITGLVHAFGACYGTRPETHVHHKYSTKERYVGNRHLLPEYKFALVMENEAYDGYVTEKLANAFMGLTVPVYFGSRDVFKVFNKESFVFYDPEAPQAALDEIARLDADPEAYAKKLAATPWTAHTEDYYFWPDDGMNARALKALVKSIIPVFQHRFVAHAITFGDGCCEQGKRRNTETALRFGATTSVSLSLKDIDPAWLAGVSDVVEQPRGKGYWVWKAKVIHDALARVNYGEFVIYSDAASHYVANIKPLLRVADEAEIMHWCSPHLEAAYTKRDTFVLLGADEPRITHTEQRTAAFVVVKKTPRTERIVRTWMAFSTDARIITDAPNEAGKENYPEFIDHRHDQSILSVLLKKERIPCWRDPSQYGEWNVPTSPYPGSYGQIFDHTRNKS